MTRKDESESTSQSSHPFNRKYFRGVRLACTLLAGGLCIGILGYHFIADLEWIDALLNAAMILTGMGEIDPLTTAGAKIFAALYALFSGIVFLTAAGAILAPMFHRVLQRFHLESGK
jgi:hypothetical protein